jgi:RND family efflux transporter MFP subunit
MQGAARPGGSAAPVVSIARLDKLRIYVYVPQDEVGSVHRGMRATVTVQGLQGTGFSGTVTRFAHSLDLATRTMLTEVDLDNPEHTLYPGMYANVTLVLQSHPNALRLPVAAVGGDESHQVFLVRDGRLAEVPVTTGINESGYIEITSGLTSQDLVVNAFNNSLKPGEAIKYELIAAGQAASLASAE